MTRRATKNQKLERAAKARNPTLKVFFLPLFSSLAPLLSFPLKVILMFLKGEEEEEEEENGRQTRSKTREEVQQQNANFMASVLKKVSYLSSLSSPLSLPSSLSPLPLPFSPPPLKANHVTGKQKQEEDMKEEDVHHHHHLYSFFLFFIYKYFLTSFLKIKFKIIYKKTAKNRTEQMDEYIVVYLMQEKRRGEERRVMVGG